MLNDVQHYVSVFAHLAVTCTFGLSLAIAIAGVSQAKGPLACGACSDLSIAKINQLPRTAQL
jgi:hypothetical protein